MNVRRPPEAPDDLRRRPGRAFSSKYALELPPPVSGSFATLPRRRAAVAKKQAELRRQALVEVALERQIWVENAEKEIALWFPEGTNAWTSHSQGWIYE